MKENNLRIAQQDIEEALTAIENIEKSIDSDNLTKEEVKERFIFLSQKVQELENILKEEGILE